mmetsp:Transcript_7732/g.28924  ORF Transcript_7732/g.28924 Transcript_7732/m.28924 type:complete len:298 (+) Transcript_7732:2058-2951(+)
MYTFVNNKGKSNATPCSLVPYLYSFKASISSRCNPLFAAATIPPFCSRNRPLVKSNALPSPSVTIPPLASTIATPAAWSHTFSRYEIGGNRRYKSASPRAKAPYFAMLSTFTGVRVLFIFDANSLVLFPFATTLSPQLSMYRELSPVALALAVHVFRFVASVSFEVKVLSLPSSSGFLTSLENTTHPTPLYATKTTPGGSGGMTSAFSGILVPPMFGHPKTPPVITPPCISPSAMAYCRPATNPFVPSMGSRIQNEFFESGSPAPRSIAVATCVVVSGSRCSNAQSLVTTKPSASAK